MAVTPPTSAAVQEEYSIFNWKGELISKIMVSGTANNTNDMIQAAYRAGINQDYIATAGVNAAKATVSPTLVTKK